MESLSRAISTGSSLRTIAVAVSVDFSMVMDERACEYDGRRG